MRYWHLSQIGIVTQEVGHCDLILRKMFFFILIVLKIHGATYALQNFSQIDQVIQEGMLILVVKQQRPYLIPEQPEFYFAEALQPCRAACEI